MSTVAIQYMLPAAVVSRADLTRLVRELEEVDNQLEQQKARGQGKSGHYQLPAMSKGLADFVAANKLDIGSDHVRLNLKAELRKLKDHAPVIHMTFSTEADTESMQYIAAWIRKELHPQALISVGLQPSLIAGAYVRTPNHVHDFSVRAFMKNSRGIIVEALDKLKEPAA